MVFSGIIDFFLKLSSLLKTGGLICAKNTFLYASYNFMNRSILNLDNNGKLLAANIILFSFVHVFNIIFLGLNSVASILISSERDKKNVQNRLMFWTIIVGLFQFLIFIMGGNFLKFFTTDI